MANKESKVTGMAGATAMIEELKFLTGSNIGADYLADTPRQRTIQSKAKGTYTKGTPPTHEEVLFNLSLGGRSLYPSEADGTQAGRIIRDDIAKHLKRTGRTVTNRQGVSKVLTKDKQTLAGAAAGLKKAAKYIASKMLDRMQAQSTTSGAGADEVSQNDGGQYARKRQRNYNIAESVIYVASGQLANAIASGKVKVYLKDANVSNLLKNIE